MQDVHADELSSQLVAEQTRLEAAALRNAADAAAADAAPLQRDPPPAAKAALRRVAAAALCMALRDLWAAEARRSATQTHDDSVLPLERLASMPDDDKPVLMSVAKGAFAAGNFEAAAVAWRVAVSVQLLSYEPTGRHAASATPLLADLLSARMRGRLHPEVRARNATLSMCACAIGQVFVLPHRRGISTGLASSVTGVCYNRGKAR